MMMKGMMVMLIHDGVTDSNMLQILLPMKHGLGLSLSSSSSWFSPLILFLPPFLLMEREICFYGPSSSMMIYRMIIIHIFILSSFLLLSHDARSGMMMMMAMSSVYEFFMIMSMMNIEWEGGFLKRRIWEGEWENQTRLEDTRIWRNQIFLSFLFSLFISWLMRLINGITFSWEGEKEKEKRGIH